MQYTKLTRKLPLFIVCTTLLFSLQVSAQQVPDAGSLLKEISRPPVQPVAPQTIKPLVPNQRPIKSDGQKILVKGFHIQGGILINEAELQLQLQHAIGKKLTFAQLQSLTLNLVGYYVSKGYVARAILPPQDITNGIIEIQVIEGKRGSLNIDNQGKLINSARVQGFIDQRLPIGAAMDFARLGEAMNILNEQPGIKAKVAITRGTGEGDVDLVVTAKGKPLVTTDVVVNNQGSRSTGEAQVQGAVTLNNPTGRFDTASLFVNANEGSAYVRADYSVAVDSSSLRIGVNASHLRYDVVQSSLSTLDPNGSARTYGINASYLLSYREDFKLRLTGSLDEKTLIDRTSTGETNNLNIRVASFGFSGFVQSEPSTFLAGGTTTFGVDLNVGDNTQSNGGALTTDNTTRQIEGHYAKLSFNLGHIRPITNTWSVSANLHGQLANKNLNSTERFSLGGIRGVRAYPVGEANGDEGWLFNIELRKNINQTLAATIFVDAGGIKLNDSTWANWNGSNTRLKNRYELYGVGVGFDWRFMPDALFSASLAVPIGENVGRDSNDHNVDGRESDQVRLWLTVTARI